MNEKKFRRSPIAIACYVIAAIGMIYSIYTIGSTVAYLNEYFASYGMTVAGNLKDALGYVLSSVVQPFSFAVIIFVAGYILDEVRALNPAYYYVPSEKPSKKAKKDEAVEETVVEAVEVVEASEAEAADAE